jgi:hypothetical protein
VLDFRLHGSCILTQALPRPWPDASAADFGEREATSRWTGR